jgi:hypothetical protein
MRLAMRSAIPLKKDMESGAFRLNPIAKNRGILTKTRYDKTNPDFLAFVTIDRDLSMDLNNMPTESNLTANKYITYIVQIQKG